MQQSNCHPFRHGDWLWMHNGLIADFPKLKRDLVFAVAPALYPAIEGSTDSEVFFHLALTFGLERDPPGAVARAAGLIERVGRDHGVEHPLQMTVATTDGRTIWAFRYSSVGQSRSLYHSTHVAALRETHPDVPLFATLSEETRLVVSEPPGDLAGVWQEVPETSCGIVRAGDDGLLPFVPVPP